MIGTPFQISVWNILRRIPYGETTTYGEIASQLARERNLPRMSAQAVGGAVGHNEISIIVPCHRVVGKNGSLTGYAGGIDKKTALLNVPGRWSVALMSVIKGAIRSNPDLTYYLLRNPPAPRICYMIRNRFPNASLKSAIGTFQKELQDFIEMDQNICSFESWMLASR